MFGLGHHGQNPPAGSGPQQPTFKIFCKGDEGYCLTVRDGNVVLTPASQPARPAPALVQGHALQLSGQGRGGLPRLLRRQRRHRAAIKHSPAQSHPVYFTSLFMFLCLMARMLRIFVVGIWCWVDSVFHAGIFAFQVKLVPFNPEVLDESVLSGAKLEPKHVGAGCLVAL
jgi:hypothetical protein